MSSGFFESPRSYGRWRFSPQPVCRYRTFPRHFPPGPTKPFISRSTASSAFSLRWRSCRCPPVRGRRLMMRAAESGGTPAGWFWRCSPSSLERTSYISTGFVVGCRPRRTGSPMSQGRGSVSRSDRISGGRTGGRDRESTGRLTVDRIGTGGTGRDGLAGDSVRAGRTGACRPGRASRRVGAQAA